MWAYSSRSFATATATATAWPRATMQRLKAVPARAWLLLGGVCVTAYTTDLPDRLTHLLAGTVRFLRSACQVAFVALDYKLSLGSLEGPEREAKKHLVHLRSAQRILDLFLTNGGIFIKAGQHVASMQHVLPLEYTHTMKACQDKAQCRPFHEVRQLVEKEIGNSLEEVFSSFEEQPFAAASLAQVHRAVLREGGQPVAVKVQYPGLEKDVTADVLTISFLLRMVEKLFPEFEFGWLVREFEHNLPQELDFLQEGHNAERMNRIFTHHSQVFAPRVYWSWTTKRVLVMEFIEGCKVNDLHRLEEMGIDRTEVSQLLTEVFSEMIFVQGFFHADPHPGNIMIRPSRRGTHPFEMVILDHGLYRQLTDDFRLHYCYLWKALLLRDEPNIRKYCTLLGAGDETYKVLVTMLTSRDQSRSSFAMSNDLTHEEVALLQEYGAKYFGKIIEVLAAVPQQMLLLFKCNDLLRSVQMDLLLPVNYFLSMGKSAQQSITLHEDQRDPSVGGMLRHHWTAFLFRFRLWCYGIFMWLSSVWSSIQHRWWHRHRPVPHKQRWIDSYHSQPRPWSEERDGVLSGAAATAAG